MLRLLAGLAAAAPMPSGALAEIRANIRLDW
jgi:hypothetical protein